VKEEMSSSVAKFGRRAIKSAAAPFAQLFQRLESDAGQVTILGYHRVVADIAQAERDSIFGLLTSTETFRRHLELVREQYEVLSLEEAVRVLRGERRAARPVAAITFDDGYRDNYEQAFPVLQRLGLPATIFVPTSYIGTARLLDHDRIYWLAQAARVCRLELAVPLRKAGLAPEKIAALNSKLHPLALAEGLVYLPFDLRERVLGCLEEAVGECAGSYPAGLALLEWEMVAEMAEAGISFGSHSDQHAVLTLEAEPEVERDLVNSKRLLEARLGRPVRHFAYPNGCYSGAIKRLMARAGFEVAVTTERRINRRGDDLLALGRICLCEESTRGLTGRYSRAVARLRLAI
jgi:peptidoglycan/xylan/chitin deacetylase (PgdA/CDA1 family)